MGRKWFSRADGRYLKHIDPFMRFFPYIMKGRNEAAIYFSQQINITQLKAYLNARNRQAAATKSGVKSTLFHAIMTALAKTMVERPQMNRFVIGRRVYQKHDMTFAFVIKREFKDDSSEEIAIIHLRPEDTLTTISQQIQDEVRKMRQAAKEDDVKRHGIVNWFNYLMNMPRILLRSMVRFLGWLDYHGWLPKFVLDLDPMHSSVFVSNLGSLGIDAPFHHLYEWGTTPIFMTIGISEKKPLVSPRGQMQICDVVNIAFTIDERISDGFYFARSLKRFKQLLEHPEELDLPTTVDKKGP